MTESKEQPVVTRTGLEVGLTIPERTSFSALDGFRTCPARWAADRTLRLPVGWLDPRPLGSLVHAMLERTAGTDGRTPSSRDGWRAVARAVIEDDENAPQWRRTVPAQTIRPDGLPAWPADWIEPAVDKIDGFHLEMTLRPAAAEQWLETSAWGIPMRGAVDYRDRSGLVLDWKTGKVPRGDGAARHADQLRCYAAMLAEQGVSVTSAADVYVEHTGRKGSVVFADLSAGAMAATGVEMNRVWRDLRDSCRAGSFGYRPSFLCGWCPLSRVCPAADIRYGNRTASMEHGLPPDTDLVTVERPPSAFRALSSTGKDSKGKEQGMVDQYPDPWALDDAPAVSEHRGAAETLPVDVDRSKGDAEDGWGFDDIVRPADGPADKPAEADRDDARTALDPTDPWETADGPAKADRVDGPAGAGVKVSSVGEAKPYDATLTPQGRLNLSGYAMGGLYETHRMAVRLAGDDHGFAGRLYQGLVRVQMQVAARVWPEAVDAPGEDNLTVARLLDSTVVRDARRLVFGYLEDDPVLSDRTAVTRDDLMAAIGRAREAAYGTMTAVRHTVTEGL